MLSCLMNARIVNKTKDGRIAVQQTPASSRTPFYWDSSGDPKKDGEDNFEAVEKHDIMIEDIIHLSGMRNGNEA